MNNNWLADVSGADPFQKLILEMDLNSSYIVEGDVATGKTNLAIWKTKQFLEAGKDVLIIVFSPVQKRFILDHCSASTSTVDLNENHIVSYSEWVSNRSLSSDYIIIDGVEDYTIAELEVIRAKVNSHWILFGDKEQQIRSFRTEINDIQNKFRLPIYRLNVNHRHHKGSISKHGSSVYTQFSKNKTKIIQKNTHKDQLNYIQSVIESKNIKNAGILIPHNSHIHRVVHHFNKRGFEVESLEDDGTSLDFNSGLPKILNYDDAKNLQFDHLFLYSFSMDAFPFDDHFVAITRSRKNISILHSKENFSTDYIDRSTVKFKKDNNYKINEPDRNNLDYTGYFDRIKSEIKLK